MADPEDPVVTPTPSQQMGDYGLISKLIIGIVLILITLALLYFIVNNYMQKKRHTVKDMVELMKLMFFTLIFMGIIAMLIAVF
jgi:magnesium-transporting ATPase (P-type)